MNCSQELIEGYVDRELDPGMKSRVEEHLAACQACTELCARVRERQVAIRSSAPYYRAPAHLRESIRDALRQPDMAEQNVARAAPPRTLPWRMLAMAASVLLTCSLAWNVAEMRSRAPEKEVLAQNILSSHLTSLLGTHLLDVVSSDRHTVKPWFNGKLDFSPEVKDLATDGFPLAGGRIEYLSGRTVAALVYQRRKHIINVFTWPSTQSDAKESHFSRNGYNELEWSNGSMTYWAVSDVAETDLQQLKSLLVK
jgi:anti-sigma factor RsiW